MARKPSSTLAVALIIGGLTASTLGVVVVSTISATVNSKGDLHGYGWAVRHGDYAYAAFGKLAHPMYRRCDAMARPVLDQVLSPVLRYSDGKPMICTQGGTLLPE